MKANLVRVPNPIIRVDTLWPPPDVKYDFIAVDFDGTLFETDFPEIGKPKREVIEWCQMHQKSGAKIILYTCRESERLDAAIEACRREGLIFDSINKNPFTAWGLTEQSIKPFADIYLDDKAWRI